MGHKAARREKKRGKKGRPAHEHAQTAQSVGGAPSAVAPLRDEVDADMTELASPVVEPPPFQPATRTKSGYAPRMQETPRVDDETLTDHLVSLQPLYRDIDANTERASELELEDPSLRLEGSFLSSPLTSTPPPAQTRSFIVLVAKAMGVLFLAASSSFGVWSAIQLLPTGGTPAPTRAEIVAPLPSAAHVVAAPTPQPPAAPPSVDDAKLEQASPPPELVAAHDPPPTTVPTTVAEPAEATAAKPVHVREPRDPVAVVPSVPAPTGAAATLTSGAPAAASPSVAPLEAAAASGTALAPTAALPKRPSPTAVRASFAELLPTMRACAGGRTGLVTFRVVVAGTGRVTSGTVEGQFPNPEERTCMTRAILDLHFPPFQQDVFEIAYPLAL